MESKIYELRFTKGSLKNLKRIPLKVRKSIEKKVFGLKNDPRPPGCKKLVGSLNSYRIRLGKYRILYEIFDNELIIHVIDIDLRSNIYK